jgi:peptidoglycan/LPS O-acetylase OafA/YrhL
VEERTDRRLPALDGLRGLAALVVLLSHVVVASMPALADAAAFGTRPAGLEGWLVRTPLSVAWAGPELVIVFFVLSGFVLTRALRDRPVPAMAFLGGRALRLYLPAWASLGVGAALVALVPRSPALAPAATSGQWLADLAQPIGAEGVAHDVALMRAGDAGAYHASLSPALWSLRWEVLFSLALPPILLARRPLARGAVPIVLLALLAVDHGRGHGALTFIPPFAIGVVLALHERRVMAWREALRERGGAVAVGLAACLLSADVWMAGAEPRTGLAGMLVLIGATFAVLAPLLYGSVAHALTTAPMRWLGARSFSLYLVHLPIVLAVAFALGRPGFGVLLAIAVPASLLAAEAFHRAVERPCHALARAATAQLASRRPAPGPAPTAAAAAPAV